MKDKIEKILNDYNIILEYLNKKSYKNFNTYDAIESEKEEIERSIEYWNTRKEWYESENINGYLKIKSKDELAKESRIIIENETEFKTMYKKMLSAKENGELDLVYEKKSMKPTYESVLKYHGFKVEELDSALVIISWNVIED
jgi:hypothetical protein